MQFRSRTISFCFILSIVLCVGIAAADDVDYLRDVKPILESRCYACHGALKQESSLRLDTAESILQGGDGGPAVISGDAPGSELIYRVTADDESLRMPPEGQALTDEQIKKITAWVQAGAPVPENEQPEQDPGKHWAFLAPLQVDVPTAAVPSDWRDNPIDAILAAEHRSHGLTPAREAEKSLLLRRLYLDLIGLPPTRAELSRFLKDERSGAWERTVDALLASPAYGERWARHWMDVWRYSDWYGLGAQVRYSQKHIWHWRDWIVESLNADKGYDRMLTEMLAADEIAPTDLPTLRATGFLARNYYLFNRTTWLDSTIEHTSKAFLGLTLNCAKCHDHKYDPLSQHDYYAMRAIFEPHQIRHDTVPGVVDLGQDGLPRAFDAHPNEPTYLHERGDEKNPDVSQVIHPATPAILDFADLQITQITLPRESRFPVLRSFVVEDHLVAAGRELARARSALSQKEQLLQAAAEQTQGEGESESMSNDVARLEFESARLRLAAAELHPAAIETAHAANVALYQDSDEAAAQQAVAEAAQASARYKLARAEYAVAQERLKHANAEEESARAKAAKSLAEAQQRIEAAKQTFESPGESYLAFEVSLKSAEGPDETEESQHAAYPSISTGRRTALAEWITDRRNPLTARVAVNHIWTRHFGQPLVDPLNDFGRRTAAPPLQPLLDWLAVELMESGWSMKHLHRLIVTSQAYRLSGDIESSSAETAQRDPANAYLWHRPPLRMQSQVVRDSLLHLAGSLDRRLGGPSVDPKQKDQCRRSLYFLHSRDDRDPFVSMFDDADILRCYRRTESIVPQQALALANSRLSHTAARALSDRLREEIGQLAPAPDKANEEFINAAFETILTREPIAEELAACLQTYDAALENHGDEPDPHAWARTVVILALFNHNDFVTIR